MDSDVLNNLLNSYDFYLIDNQVYCLEKYFLPYVKNGIHFMKLNCKATNFVNVFVREETIHDTIGKEIILLLDRDLIVYYCTKEQRNCIV
jgi:hypothetical protein